MKTPKLSFSLQASWQFISSSVLILGLIGLVLLTSINTLLPGYSSTEVSYVKETATPSAIIHNPEFLPHKALSFVLHFVTHDNYLSARLASAFIGGAVILLFYYGANKWYSRRTAFLTTVLLASSAWFLHITRIGIPDITYPAAFLALAITAYKLQVTKRPVLLWSFAILLIGVLWYIPGILWLAVLGLALQYKRLRASVSPLTRRQLLVLLAPAAVSLGLLAAFCIIEPRSILTVLGVSGGLPAPVEYAKQLLYTPFIVALRAPLDAGFRLGHLPYLDIISCTLLLAGVYYYFVYGRSLRTRLILLMCAGGIILSALQTYQSQAILLVPAFILIAAGISVATNPWLTVFPRNPVARTLGIAAVSLVVGLSCVYSLRSYFIAWPNTPATKDVYNQVL